MRTILRFCFFALLFLFALDSALAQPGSVRESRRTRQKVFYPKETQLDYDGTQIEGELRRPGEFYFQHRPAEKFDSLVKRRKEFHREMLRDSVMSK